MLKQTIMAASAVGMALALAAGAQAQMAGQKEVVDRSKAMVPAPPWPKGDERGMANGIGPGTWMRCAYHLNNAKSKAYEISHVRSNTMPSSPFGAPLKYKFTPTVVLPFTKHAFNGEQVLSGEPGAQGTQMDALGHFAYIDKPWIIKKGQKSKPPSGNAKYYGGYTQKDVKPKPDSPLLRLGIDKVPPIVTTAVVLDAKSFVGKGTALKDGAIVTAAHIEGMLKAQGLAWRGILPGDVVYIYTGWSEQWKDPDVKKTYYTMGPGLSYDGAKYIEQKRAVLVALDNPFTDPVAKGMLQGKAPPAPGTPKGLPFAIHHHNLTQSGIHQIQNANLAAMVRDKVWTSCTMILPLRSKGGAGSPVRPVAIGAPGQS